MKGVSLFLSIYAPCTLGFHSLLCNHIGDLGVRFASRHQQSLQSTQQQDFIVFTSVQTVCLQTLQRNCPSSTPDESKNQQTDFKTP